uniref:G-protein coupled receptors family 1 profile domain-containing protein n=1 Tax=Hucho hucho TaxID=62062 RepID=A0A4W5LWN1_9TELE
MGQDPCRPNPPLPRTTLGQLCTTSSVSRSRLAATEPVLEPGSLVAQLAQRCSALDHCNGLLLVAMCRYEDLRRVTNMFILNLLTSDLLFTLTLPFWAVYQLSHWMFGDLACKLLTGAYFTGLYSSMMLLTSMTVYRCVIVVKSRWTAVPRRRLRYAWAACTASWVVSLAASVSDAISSQVQEVENGTFTCEFSLGTTNEKLGYYLQVSLLFVLPLIIIILCYSAILRTVLVTATRRRHRTVLVVFCIVVAFFVCWAPYNLIIFVLSVYTPVDCGVKQRLHVVFIVCRIVAYAHCFLNPALYMLSHSFRRHSMLSSYNMKNIK